ncbi:MAG: hypothetical protein OXG09_02970 [Chloroflexi bacterium]|nr:hypothetical protein [Chloroflexota bacterium]
MQENWQKNYKPMIELLLQQENGHYAAFTLAFCCVEHVYRAIKKIDPTDKTSYAQPAIRHVIHAWVNRKNHFKDERLQEERREKLENYAFALLQGVIFNQLKHLGHLTGVAGKNYTRMRKNLGRYKYGFPDPKFSDNFDTPITSLGFFNEQPRTNPRANTYRITTSRTERRNGENKHEINSQYWVQVIVDGIDAAYQRALSIQDKLGEQ